jgi:glutamate dehydrogenase/leucine dehydrogenase
VLPRILWRSESLAYALLSVIGQTADVPIQKIAADTPSPMTGFVVTDLPGSTRATGVVRLAKKILMDGAKTMARSQTYSWAILNEQVSGASAGVSVDPSESQAGMVAFVDAVLDRVSAGELSLVAAKGVSDSDLSQLAQADTRSKIGQTARAHGTLNQELLAEGAFAAAATAHGSLEGARVILEGTGANTAACIAAAATHGARIVGLGTFAGVVVNPEGFNLEELLGLLAESGTALPTSLGSEVASTALFQTQTDLLFCGSKMGLIDHLLAETLDCKMVVPVAPAPVTAKGLAVATHRGIAVLPDFISTAGPLFADHPADSATAEQIVATATDTLSSALGQLSTHPEGLYLAACYAAEAFLLTWQESLPFGRPLA